MYLIKLIVSFFLLTHFSVVYSVTAEIAAQNMEKAELDWNQFSFQLNEFTKKNADFIEKEKDYLKETGRFFEYQKNHEQLVARLAEASNLFIKLREELATSISLTTEKLIYQKALYSYAYLEFTEVFICFLKSQLIIEDQKSIDGKDAD